MTDERSAEGQAFVLAEYEYLAQAAFHNNEERARASSLGGIPTWSRNIAITCLWL